VSEGSSASPALRLSSHLLATGRDEAMRTLWDYAEEQQSEEGESESKKSSKELRIEEERRQLLQRVSSFNVDTVRDRVAWILNCYPETRDSDIALQLKYWRVFEFSIYSGGAIKPDDLYRLTRLTTLSRARAKIQNEYKLFLASPEVRQRRGTLAEEEKAKALEDKPNYPVFIVYMDDSGKNANHLIVGSVWFLADFMSVFLAVRNLREQEQFDREFHFKEIRRDTLGIYKDVIDVFLKHAHAVSFKLVTVPRAGVPDITEALTDLYYHTLVRGIEHEQETDRAPLPRKLQVWVDAEEAGLDRVRLANLDDRLRQVAKTRFNDELIIDRVEAGESKANLMLQVADLFAGSVNRILNRSGTKATAKDELAEYLLGSLGIDFALSPNDTVGDMSVHISL
jgi:hypothetical protein